MQEHMEQQDSRCHHGALNRTTGQSPNKNRHTKPSEIKKELAEGQLCQLQEKHEITEFQMRHHALNQTAGGGLSTLFILLHMQDAQTLMMLQGAWTQTM